MRIVGPMQSWGTQSRFVDRDTGREPSKSGIIGLLCAALGKPRQECDGDGYPSLAELAGLRMGVRVDREGVMVKDYHTAGGGWIPTMAQLYFPKRRATGNVGVVKADGSSGDPVVSTRYYLADAAFLVCLEGANRELLERLASAIADPVWPVALGRKSFVPAMPICPPEGALSDKALVDALTEHQWLVKGDVPPTGLRLVIEDSEGAEVRNDQPVCFLHDSRSFVQRRVRTTYLTLERVAKQEVL